jgi:DinB superfamily
METTMLTKTERQKLIAEIQCFPEELAQVVNGLSQQQLMTVSIPNEWTVQQIVHHLADSHMNALVRLKLILTRDNPPLQGYPQDIWAELADVNAVPIEASLSILRGLHARWTALFESLPDEAWSRKGLHSENGDTSVEDVLTTYAWHGRNHIDQIQRVLAAQG